MTFPRQTKDHGARGQKLVVFHGFPRHSIFSVNLPPLNDRFSHREVVGGPGRILLNSDELIKRDETLGCPPSQ